MYLRTYSHLFSVGGEEVVQNEAPDQVTLLHGSRPMQRRQFIKGSLVAGVSLAAVVIAGTTRRR